MDTNGIDVYIPFDDFIELVPEYDWASIGESLEPEIDRITWTKNIGNKIIKDARLVCGKYDEGYEESMAIWKELCNKQNKQNVIETDMINVSSHDIKSISEVGPPYPTSDVSLGYHVGSTWCDTVTHEEYVCTDNTENAAVWINAHPKNDNNDNGRYTYNFALYPDEHQPSGYVHTSTYKYSSDFYPSHDPSLVNGYLMNMQATHNATNMTD